MFVHKMVPLIKKRGIAQPVGISGYTRFPYSGILSVCTPDVIYSCQRNTLVDGEGAAEMLDPKE